MWSTTDAEKTELVRTIAALHGPRVLEIGAFKGETTRVLAEAAARRGGYVVVIDPMRWAAEVVANGIARHLPSALSSLTSAVGGLLGEASYERAFWQNVGELRPHVILHRAVSGSPELLRSEALELRSFDVVFIDGDHSHDGASRDLAEWGCRTVAGGTILVHDATARFPGVLTALREFEVRHDVEVRYPTTDSLASIRVRSPLGSARGHRGEQPRAAWPAPQSQPSAEGAGREEV